MLSKKYFWAVPIVILALFSVTMFAYANGDDDHADDADLRAAEELVELDENITAEDLNIEDPSILPNSPFYVFKGISRSFQSFFTFNPVKKAELKLRFANEKIIEVKKMEESGAGDETIRRAIESYERDVEQVRIHIDRAIERQAEGVSELVERVIDNQIKHYKLLGKFERERDSVAPEIEKAKQEAMRHFTEAAAAAFDPEELREKFENALAQQEGSVFKHFKHIEMLEEVKDFVPEQARDAIQNAIENSSKFFQEDFGAASEAQRKIFNRYMEKTGGNEVRHLEAFDALSSSVDFDTDMFEEMERAREKSRARVEERMRGIEDEARKKVFLAHLEGARMEDARIVQELENNLSPETVTAILDIKHTIDQKIRERFEQAESLDDLDSFFKEIEGSPDVQMMQVLKEMDKIIPKDKKVFWEEMKLKTMSEMQKEIDRAERLGRTQDKLRQVAGFDPEHIGVFDEFEDEFGAQFDFFDGVRKEQAGRIEVRFKNFREFANEGEGSDEFFRKTEEFRLRIESDPFANEDIRRFAPGIADEFRRFDIQRDSHGFSEEAVRENMEEAARLIERLTQKLNTAGAENPGIEASRKLLAEAREKLARAKEALAQGRSGEAFGESNAAIHIAGNGLRRLEAAAFEKERRRSFEERDEFFEQFKGVAPAERPNIEEFLRAQAPIELDRENREGERGGVFELPRILRDQDAIAPPESILDTKPTTCPLFPFVSVDRKKCEARGGRVVEKTLFGCGIIGEECVVEEQKLLEEPTTFQIPDAFFIPKLEDGMTVDDRLRKLQLEASQQEATDSFQSTETFQILELEKTFEETDSIR